MIDREIREFREEDIDAALRLWASSEGLGTGPGDSVVALRRFLSRNPGMSWVAVEDGALAAAILCGHDGRRGYLYHLAVAAGHRRRGLATALVRRSISMLRSEGILRCLVVVQSDNASAAEFWSALRANRRSELNLFSIDIQTERGGDRP